MQVGSIQSAEEQNRTTEVTGPSGRQNSSSLTVFKARNHFSLVFWLELSNGKTLLFLFLFLPVLGKPQFSPNVFVSHEINISVTGNTSLLMFWFPGVQRLVPTPAESATPAGCPASQLSSDTDPAVVQIPQVRVPQRCPSPHPRLHS